VIRFVEYNDKGKKWKAEVLLPFIYDSLGSDHIKEDGSIVNKEGEVIGCIKTIEEK